MDGRERSPLIRGREEKREEREYRNGGGGNSPKVNLSGINTVPTYYIQLFFTILYGSTKQMN